MKVTLSLLLITGCLAAQPRGGGYNKHNVSAFMGAGLPKGELQPYFADSFGLGVSYGYRFHRNFQADVGLDTIFHAAEIRDVFSTQLGDLRIRDYQYLVPFGGRAIIPVFDGRLQFHGGGGPAYMRYQERIRQPFGDAYVRLDCIVCRARDGWGWYALAGASVALDRRHHFRLGLTSKAYRGETGGDAFGLLPPFTTRDRWINLFGEFVFSF